MTRLSHTLTLLAEIVRPWEAGQVPETSDLEGLPAFLASCAADAKALEREIVNRDAADAIAEALGQPVTKAEDVRRLIRLGSERGIMGFLQPVNQALKRAWKTDGGISGGDLRALFLLLSHAERMAVLLLDRVAEADALMAVARDLELPTALPIGDGEAQPPAASQRRRRRGGGIARPDLGPNVASLPIVARPIPRTIPIGDGPTGGAA